MTILETNRLLVRQLTMDDFDNIFTLVSDPEIMRYMSPPKTHTETQEMLAGILDNYKTQGFHWWAAILKSDQSFAGYVGPVMRQVDGKREIELGYAISKTHWNTGLATESAKACRDYAFHVLGCKHLIAIIDPEHIASRRVAEKIGMILEKETVWRDEKVCIYAIDQI